MLKTEFKERNNFKNLVQKSGQFHKIVGVQQ